MHFIIASQPTAKADEIISTGFTLLEMDSPVLGASRNLVPNSEDRIRAAEFSKCTHPGAAHAEEECDVEAPEA